VDSGGLGREVTFYLRMLAVAAKSPSFGTRVVAYI